MTDLLAISFGRQVAEIKEYLASSWKWPSPEAGFALYVFHAAKEYSGLPDVQSLSWLDRQQLRHAHGLSAAGFLLACDWVAGETREAEWAIEFDHLSKTDAFPLDRQSFAYRPLEVLGIAFGIAKCSRTSEASRNAFRDIVSRLPAAGNRDEWSRLIYRLAAKSLSCGVQGNWSSERDDSIATRCLRKWLNVTSAAAFEEESDLQSLDREILFKASEGALELSDVGRASVAAFGLQRTVAERIESSLKQSWQTNCEARDALSIVEYICRRFPLFARQLQVRRQDVAVRNSDAKKARPTIAMRDEYDVQDTLHALLKLHFDDVRKEEWAPSYAGGQSRMDFVLKEHKIVIETKFMGQRLTQTEVAKQLAIDEKFYRPNQDCRTLVCFVYDPDHRCHNPTALELDTRVDGDFRVVVIVAPKGV